MIANVHSSSTGPLAERDLAQIYERIIDVMRSIQKHEIAPDDVPAAHETAVDSQFED